VCARCARALVTPTGAAFTAVWTGTFFRPAEDAADTSYIFGIKVPVGYVRLWIDDHLLVDGGKCKRFMPQS
jgi:hypothetical protein